MKSVILSYSRTINSLSSMDGTVTLAQPLRFQREQKHFIRLIKASFSSLIPNVYTLGTFNNGLVRVSKDGGVNWTSIQLPNGVYSIPMINAAINETVSAWYTDPTIWGITLKYNLSTQFAYVELDSTKLLVPGQLSIDFSVSSISDLLGYNVVGNQIFLVDGVHTADSYAKLNWTGDGVSIQLEGLGPISLRNGDVSNELCSIPLSATKNANEFVFPVGGIISPIIELDQPVEELASYRVVFKGSRLSGGVQMPIYLMEGNVDVTIELMFTPAVRRF